MSNSSSPKLSVVPIVKTKETDSEPLFCGAGFFAGKGSVLVTCANLIELGDTKYGIRSRAHAGKVVPAKPVLIDQDLNIAILEVEIDEAFVTLPLAADKDVVLNKNVTCFGFGVTAEKAVGFASINRIGNVTRFRDFEEVFHGGGKDMLELSFPITKGGIGAPIFEQKLPHKVWGIVVGNIASDEIPVLTPKLIDESTIYEETNHTTPHALAVHVKHLRALI